LVPGDTTHIFFHIPNEQVTAEYADLF